MSEDDEKIEDVFFTINGVEYCAEDLALSRLLRDEVLGVNERDISFLGKPAGSTVVLFVNCNDLFYWGCADAEDLPLSEVGRLYRMHVADPRHGATRWCCLRRNMRPQVPIVLRWKELGIWDEEMEALPAPRPS